MIEPVPKNGSADRVQDSIGIEAIHLQRFSSGFTADKGSRGTGGTGLGLSLVGILRGPRGDYQWKRSGRLSGSLPLSGKNPSNSVR
jgi:hypothetical protein